MNATADAEKKVWTEAELEALPDNGYKYELVNGELVISPKNNFQHENLCGRLYVELANYNQAHRLGVVLGSNLGCWMKSQNCRAPDISFISKERLQRLGFKPSIENSFPALRILPSRSCPHRTPGARSTSG